MSSEFQDLCVIFEEMTRKLEEIHDRETITAAWLGNCPEQEDCSDIYFLRGIRMGSRRSGSDV